MCRQPFLLLLISLQRQGAIGSGKPWRAIVRDPRFAGFQMSG
jgi:hypothetical protein